MPYHVRFAAKKKQGGEFVVFESTAMQMIVMFVRGRRCSHKDSEL